ncbi:MAG: hypothetical protein WB626_06990 [Bacteroidota bacterium]
MRHGKLLFRLGVFLWAGYLTWFLATGYRPADAGFHPPFLIRVLDLLNLFIHEAGHLFLKPFGMWVHIIGGSLFQVLAPAALAAAAWRRSSASLPLPVFWLGESLVNVSVYIQDAPTRKLKLIAKGLIHDWGWLLAGKVHLAGPIADGVLVAGLAACTAAAGWGIFTAVRDWQREGQPAGLGNPPSLP